MKVDHPKLHCYLLQSLALHHGGWIARVLDDADTIEDLGPDFGGDLSGREVDYLIREEWAAMLDDIFWRQTKSDLNLDAAGRQQLETCVTTRTAVAALTRKHYCCRDWKHDDGTPHKIDYN